MVDSGAERSTIVQVPRGMEKGEGKIKVAGVGGKPIIVPEVEDVEIKYKERQAVETLILVPQAGMNLMGRDLQIQLRIGTAPEHGEIIVKVYSLTEQEEEAINQRVWAEKGNRGGLKIEPIKIKLTEGMGPVRVRQYPISLEGRKRLQPVIETLEQDGVIETCMSPYNTPVLPVKKTDGTYRLVQDLRELNKIVEKRHPVVPNPYTIMSQIPHEHKWFSVVDLKDAFWSCPLDKGSRDIFAFEWENPKTHRKQQYRWTVLPQGFTESPNLFGQVLEQTLESFTCPSGTQLLQYVDDLLISGIEKEKVGEGTIELLNFLGEKGLRVSKNKLQFVEKEVRYLGHLVSEGRRRINPDRIRGITALTPPRTVKEIRKFLGLIGYCRIWIENYAAKTKFLYEKMTSVGRVTWTKEEVQQYEDLKDSLVTAPVLSLPALEKPFYLYVNVEGGTAMGVLAQKWGGNKKPIAYLSKLLDPVTRGWPVCIQAVAATAILVEESRKLTFGGDLIVATPHTVHTILTQRSHRWLTDSRILKYEAILMERDDLSLVTDKSLNPSQYLYEGQPDDPQSPEHNCLDLIEYQTKSREDLREEPLPEGRRWFIDGSSRCIDGKRHSGYAIVDGQLRQKVEVGRLPNDWSAQTCELYALKRALELLKEQMGTIYTDSKYAFGVVHTFGKIWQERGMITTRGKGLAHEKLIEQTLQALDLPEEIAVVHVSGHQQGHSPEAMGNRLADEEAKQAALGSRVNIMSLIPTPIPMKKIPIFNEKEKEMMRVLGASKDTEGLWKLQDGRQVLNKELTKEVIGQIHAQSHWGTQALCDTFLRVFACPGVHTLAQQVTHGCLICQKVNKGVMRKSAKGGRVLAVRPFQCIQIDFTEFPKVQNWRYALVVVDHYTRWVEVFPTTSATAQAVSRILLEQIIPRYGIMESINSDRGTHFTSKVHQTVCEALGIRWELHTPWHPQSSGIVERMNSTLKTQITKLMLETRLPWTKCLPLALIRIRTAPRKDIGASPYEMMFGLPYMGKAEGIPIIESNDVFLRNYLLAVSRSLTELKEKGLLAQTPPLDFCIHNIKPGDWVLIKTWKEEKLQPKWEGPFLVLLTTETSVRTKEKGWTHATRTKGPVSPPKEKWTITQGTDPLKIRISKDK